MSRGRCSQSLSINPALPLVEPERHQAVQSLRGSSRQPSWFRRLTGRLGSDLAQRTSIRHVLNVSCRQKLTIASPSTNTCRDQEV